MQTAVLSPLVKAYDLKPHIEGGWYKETWKASFDIPRETLGPHYSGARASASAVYFLLHPGETSKWHKVLSDEMWLYHSGGPLKLTLGGDGDKPGKEESVILGLDHEKGHRPQWLVPANVWQTATPLSDEPVFVSCIVAPAFHYDDFTLIED